MSNVMAAYGRNDVKNIRRDTMLIGVMAGPFIYSAMTWVVEPLTGFLQRTYDFDLTPYYPLIVSSFLILGPIAVLGAVCGLMLLDDKDQRTLSALRVTPAPPMSYPVYRMLMVTVVTALSETAAMVISPITNGDLILTAFPITVLSGLLATIVGLLMAAIARNKVEGLAVIRALGLIVFMVPSIPWFIDSPWSLLFGILPSYWPSTAIWVAIDGGNHWPYLAAGFVYCAVIIALLLRRVARQRELSATRPTHPGDRHFGDRRGMVLPQVCREVWSATLSSTPAQGAPMRARDLAAPFPTVEFSTPALEAARLLAGQDLPGLIVIDDAGLPSTILAGTQVLRMAIPSYCQDDPALARVVDEAAADVFLSGVGDRTVAELLPAKHRELPVVDPEATVLEIAAVMAATAVPLVAVAHKRQPMLGAITLDALLDRMLGT